MTGEGRLRVGVLGPIRVATAEGAPADPAGPNARALVAALALAHPAVLSIDALADDVWEDEAPRNPRGALQTLVSRLRSAAGADIIRSEAAGYALGVPADHIDLARARTLIEDAAALPAADPARLALVDEALALWRGEAGADLADAPVAGALAVEAEGLYERSLRLRGGSLLALGRAADAIPDLTALAASHPYDETAHLDLMTALAADGRDQEALAAFAGFRERLRDDLGSSPGDASTELNARLLRGEAAPSAVGRVRIGIRAAPNELIGRAADLAAVEGLLARSRVVTILGPGGLGKTRLANAIGHASAAPAVVGVPLAGVRTDDGVPIAIAGALGIAETAPSTRLADAAALPDLRSRIVGQLSERPTLLILDNCEQVIDGVAEWTAELVAAVPSLRVLTTSRTPVAVSSEAVYPLDPLPALLGGEPGPAVSLFLERARAVRPGAQLPLDVVARLCTHLDGLPLAIELAAARVRTMTPEQIEARLEHRFALLTSGDRTAPDRHRTLEAVIEWSWDLLDDSARRAMATLAVLPAGFSADTAAAILGDEPVDDLLDRLVSQSLLVVLEDRVGIRFRMLETVREFALVRLERAGGMDAAWAAVLRWAAAFARERAPGVFRPAAHREIRAEQDNLVAVLRRAVADGEPEPAKLVFAMLGQTWIVRGGFDELGLFQDAMFDLVARRPHVIDDPDADLLARALLAVTYLFMQSPRAVRALALVRIASRADGLDPMSQAVGALVLAVSHMDELPGVIARMRRSEVPRVALVGAVFAAQLAENDGRAAEALEASESAWELASMLGEQWFAATAASGAAQLASELAHPEQALAWLERADRDFAAFDAVEALRQGEWMRAGALAALGRLDEARVMFDALASSGDRTEDGIEMASIGWFGIAEVDRLLGDPTASRRHYERAMASFTEGGQRVSPWYLMALAGLVSGGTFDGSFEPERLEVWARRLRARAIALHRIRPDYVDKPVLGTVLMGWSAWAAARADLRDRGVEALALAGELGSRQDLPSLHLDVHLAHAVELAGADAVAAARAAASALPRTELVPRALAVLSAPVP